MNTSYSGQGIKSIQFIYMFCMLFCVVAGGSGRLMAQGITDLGTLPGDTTSFAYAINNSDVVAGISIDHGFWHGVSWANGQVQPISGSNMLCWLGDVNSSGILCGYATDTTGIAWRGTRAATWHDGTMTLIPPDPAPATWAFGINDSGWVVGHRFDTTGIASFAPFIYKNGTFSDLPRFRNGKHGLAKAINNHGIVAGYATTGQSDLTNMGCLWFKGKIYQIQAGGYPHGWVFDINDNDVAVGVLDDGDNTWGHLALWQVTIVGDTVLQISGPTIPSLDDRWSIYVGGNYQMRYPVSINNKNVVVAAPRYNQSSYIYSNGQFAWLDSLGTNIAPFNSYGLTAYGINDSGHIVGTGYVNNKSHAFMMNARYLKIDKPAENDLMISGEQNVIHWSSSGIDLVNLYIKRENTATYDTIALNVLGTMGEYTWAVPDTFLARRVKIRIEDVNSSAYSESKTFRIKGYMLTRVTPDGEYERFRPNIHGWSIPNNGDRMWPESWYSQFNYLGGIDPRTGKLYPRDWSRAPIAARPEDFPDWQLLTETYGVDQCYYKRALTGTLTYIPSAVLFWKNNKAAWQGSCYGLLMSSLLAFDRKQVFLSHFGLPDFTNLSDVGISSANRLVINQIHWTQFSVADLTHRQENHETALQTLANIKTMLMEESNDNRSLLFMSLGPGGGAHLVSPFKVTKDPGNSAIERIYVYDSNIPGDSTIYMAIDTGANTWSYQSLGWTGSVPGSFFLSRPASATLDKPLMSHPLPVTPFLAKADVDSGRIEIHHSLVGNGGINGYVTYDVSTGVTILFPGVMPIIPIAGAPHPPIGYSITSAPELIFGFRFLDSNAYVSMEIDSLIYVYARPDADTNFWSGDAFHYLRDGSNAGLRVSAGDSGVATFQTIIRSDSNERVYSFTNCLMNNYNQIRLNARSERGYLLANQNDPRTCSMSLLLASPQGTVEFLRDTLQLDENTAYTIIPNWDSLATQPVKILIDHGQDGTFEDSITVTGVVTGADDSGTPHDPPIPATFALRQNYPNPFNPITTIRYQLPVQSHVTLKIFDVLGREVAMLVNDVEGPGYISVKFDASGLPSGVYYYRLQADNFIEARKLLLLR